MENQQATSDSGEMWAVVELFGHQVIAGRIAQDASLGVPMLRVDVPEIGGRAAFTKFYGSGAVYAVAPCTEEYARHVADYYKPKPITVYVPEMRQLPRPYTDSDDNPEGREDGDEPGPEVDRDFDWTNRERV